MLKYFVLFFIPSADATQQGTNWIPAFAGMTGKLAPLQ
jgi:hypothetical protein